jgi:hypothetical protein
MSARAYINFREILKQQTHSNEFRLELSARSGKASVGNRFFKFNFAGQGSWQLLKIEFQNCHPNPCYLLRDTDNGWTMQDGDPVDDMSSAELAHHCVAMLNAME